MIIKKLSELPARREQAVIINAGTSLVTALAILSTLRYSGMPLLVVDCPVIDNNSTEYDYLTKLMSKFDFDLISLPLNAHGLTLDYIFRNIPADYVLLVDSDLEILNGTLFPVIRRYLGGKRDSRVFGFGFTHGPCWIVPDGLGVNREGYLAERIWIPFTMLNVKLIREALKDGKSFSDKIFFNLFPAWQKLSRFLLERVNLIHSWNFKFLSLFKKEIHGKKVNTWYFDTGAEIFQYLKNTKQYCYVGVDISTGIAADFVHHYEGITRRILYEEDSHNSVKLDHVSDEIKIRLKSEYNFEFPITS